MRDRPRRTTPVADVRRGRRRPDRRRSRGPARRAVTRGRCARNFRHIDPAAARIVLIDSGPAILPPFPEPLRARAARDLRDDGSRDPCRHEGHRRRRARNRDELARSRLRRIEAATKFWAAGVEASPLGRLVAEAAGAEIDRAGRVKVEPDCTLPGHPEVFVVGDLMSLDRPAGRGAGRDPVRPPRRGHDHATDRGRHHAAAVPLPRPRNDGDDLTLPRDRGARPPAHPGFLAWISGSSSISSR